MLHVAWNEHVFVGFMQRVQKLSSELSFIIFKLSAILFAMILLPACYFPFIPERRLQDRGCSRNHGVFISTTCSFKLLILLFSHCLWLLLPSTPPLKMLSYTFSRSDTTPLLCVLLHLFTDQIEGLDQLQLLKVTHTSIEAGARHNRLVSACMCVHNH